MKVLRAYTEILTEENENYRLDIKVAKSTWFENSM